MSKTDDFGCAGRRAIAVSETVRVVAFHDSTTIAAVIAVQVKVCNLDVAAAAPSGPETLENTKT
jgi:hypothetical protein